VKDLNILYNINLLKVIQMLSKEKFLLKIGYKIFLKGFMFVEMLKKKKRV